MINILITKTVKVKWNNSNKKHYESKGYKFTKVGEEFECRVEDINKNNTKHWVECLCNSCKHNKVKMLIRTYNNSGGYILCDKCKYLKYNTYIYKDDYIELHVNNTNTTFIIDKEHEDFAKEYIWFAFEKTVNGNNFHYLTTKKKVNGKWVKYRYHQLIMQEEIEKYRKEHNYNKKIIVDHINGNTIDNRKNNLRVRTQSENNMNKQVQVNNTSNIVGVNWNKQDKMWFAYISYNNKRIRLGYFYYLRNAVKTRVEAEKKYFGEHAFISRDEEYGKFIKKILSLENKKEPVIYSITKKIMHNKPILIEKWQVQISIRENDQADLKQHRKLFDINELDKAKKYIETMKIKYSNIEFIERTEKQEKLI